MGDKQFPRALALNVSWPAELWHGEDGLGIEVAGRCSCWLWAGFPTGPLLLQVASLTAKVALGGWQD